ncbi:MAG TPA: hypothetical protein DC054_25945 [Blastocatellia bacterium]|nr:hypothetical protein [Blastocatellia bacterium]
MRAPANEVSISYAREEVISFSLRSLSDLRVSLVNIRLKTLTAETQRSPRRRREFQIRTTSRSDGTSVAPDIADVAYEATLKSPKMNTRFAPQAKRILP